MGFELSISVFNVSQTKLVLGHLVAKYCVLPYIYHIRGHQSVQCEMWQTREESDNAGKK